MVDKQRNQHYPLVPISIILSALKEDPISIKMILKHYHGYITKLCLKNGFNEVGQFITYVDEYMLSGVCQYSCRIFIFHLSKSRTSLWSVGLVIQ
ncbi:helix-turn-helix domain-containing protein [Enterococcus faecalis]|uniref:helix-turn-helix domain-containing protein n=2 Tax=Enterococcus TaxID=1350 RepID=UPI0021B12984|nr:helix-turn-helix domain-containing protein [Enterococcus faecalis]